MCIRDSKGALYSFALLLSALGRGLAEGGDPFDTAAAIAGLLIFFKQLKRILHFICKKIYL